MKKDKHTICVVDDDPSVCKALKRLIKSVGFCAETYTSAQEFLDNGHKEEPDLLVLDVRMPMLSGLELQKQLVDSGSRIPIVFTTAHEDGGARAAAMERGAVAFLHKPFNDQLLLDAISRGLETRKS